MSTEVIVALIALAGVVLSVAVSLFTSMRQTSNELARLRAEIQQTYADKLLEKRLETYPDMVFLLSEFAKKIELRSISKRDVEALYRETNQCDSKISVFFGGHTGNVSFYFRQMLRKLMEKSDEEFRKHIGSPDALKELKEKVGEFELALKSDLGIYAVEFADPSKRFVSYRDISRAIEKPATHRNQR